MVFMKNMWSGRVLSSIIVGFLFLILLIVWQAGSRAGKGVPTVHYKDYSTCFKQKLANMRQEIWRHCSSGGRAPEVPEAIIFNIESIFNKPNVYPLVIIGS